ncbi:MAG: hypothetical protein US94_C0012G0007 [Berkelbacteria bacterium GW2011_GWB1_38_5]|uniref:Uncharacterized protein n=2 Tax=Candidatus Berkelbacteria TaxID=1618330 RepID=A0A0G0PN70_9BACT|nr:MAG: hypothetical protein US94_C0012G0007 [Berkelbacteria bacterium GW2011_GWB1_38_5]KKQ90756.1 MAG: hypothetical protein UT15_C0005G0006 [Berkelbacteria bacterium GW2011_GWA1_39_10]
MEDKTFKKLLDDQTKHINENLTTQTVEMQRHQKMLLEEFDSRLKIIVEVQVDHTKKFNEIFKKLDAIMEMTALNTENIEMIKGMLKRKVDYEEYEKLEKRVLVLEKKLRMTGV